MKKLRKNIQILRRQKELSQESFAHMADLDRSYIGQVERNISFENLCKIAVALDVSVSALTEGV